MTRYLGVGFNDGLIAKMKKVDFIAMHEKALWLDRKLTERRKMLSEVYDMITKKTK